jgi:hypothetical protein
MTITTHLTRFACGTAAAGVLLLGGAGVAQAQEQTPGPPPGTPSTVAPKSAAPKSAAPQTVAPQVAPGAPGPRQLTSAAAPAPQVRALPEGAPETGGGPADPALGSVAALVGGGALAVVVAAGAVTVAVRRRP